MLEPFGNTAILFLVDFSEQGSFHYIHLAIQSYKQKFGVGLAFTCNHIMRHVNYVFSFAEVGAMLVGISAVRYTTVTQLGCAIGLM